MTQNQLRELIEKAEKNGYASHELNNGKHVVCVKNQNRTVEDPAELHFYKLDAHEFTADIFPRLYAEIEVKD